MAETLEEILFMKLLFVQKVLTHETDRQYVQSIKKFRLLKGVRHSMNGFKNRITDNNGILNGNSEHVLHVCRETGI